MHCATGGVIEIYHLGDLPFIIFYMVQQHRKQATWLPNELEASHTQKKEV